MYAVVATGGKQYKVAEGDILQRQGLSVYLYAYHYGWCSAAFLDINNSPVIWAAAPAEIVIAASPTISDHLSLLLFIAPSYCP